MHPFDQCLNELQDQITDLLICGGGNGKDTCQGNILYDIQARPRKNPFGLLYRVDKCFPDFFHHRTLHPEKKSIL